jgi:ubiquinone/menaquinone biosynthesis C-methylase UbiE
MGNIEAFYDAKVDYEWHRLERHKLEYRITSRNLQTFLRPGSRVLDVGGGPGRYSIDLARQGHQVTLLDLSQKNVDFAKARAAEAGAPVAAFVHGNALDLTRYADNYFDAVLLMGPLYHLVDEKDRQQALAEAYRVLKPDGVLFAAFISRFAVVIDTLKDEPSPLNLDEMRGYLRTGINPGSDDLEGFTAAYFMHPSAVKPLMEGAGFHTRRISAVEGPVAANEARINQLPDAEFDRWVDLVYELGTDPTMWGATEHLLYVGTK